MVSGTARGEGNAGRNGTRPWLENKGRTKERLIKKPPTGRGRGGGSGFKGGRDVFNKSGQKERDPTINPG